MDESCPQCFGPTTRVLSAKIANVLVCERCSAALVDPASGHKHFLTFEDVQSPVFTVDGQTASEWAEDFMDKLEPLAVLNVGEPRARVIRIGLSLGIGYYAGQTKEGEMSENEFRSAVGRLAIAALAETL